MTNATRTSAGCSHSGAATGNHPNSGTTNFIRSRILDAEIANTTTATRAEATRERPRAASRHENSDRGDEEREREDI